MSPSSIAALRAARCLLLTFILMLPAGASWAVMPVDEVRFLDSRLNGEVTPAVFPKWAAAMGRDWARGEASEACDDYLQQDCRLGAWRSFLSALPQESLPRLLERVNRFVNRVAYRPDRFNWGSTDYWAAPGEFFARGGDCEDYAIAKYYSLRALGIPASRMRIVVLNDTLRRRSHAVLAVRGEGGYFVLDNIRDRVVSWHEVAHYRPVYSVNESSYWLHPWRQVAGPGTDTLPPASD